MRFNFNISSKKLIILLLVAIAYFFSGKIGLGFATINPSASPIWAPTGIAIGVLIIAGYQVWPAIFVGALLVNFTTTHEIFTSIAIAGGNTGEALIALYLVRKTIKVNNPFLKPSHIFKFIFFVVFFSTMFSATVGTTALYIGKLVPPALALSTWLTWWLGDIGGALVVAPAIVLWWYDRRSYRSLTRILEILLLFSLLIVPPLLVFAQILPPTLTEYPIAFIPLPILVWIAYRFGPREASFSIIILSTLVILSTVSGYGPFVRVAANQSLVIVQMFMGIVFFSVMPLATASYDQKETEELLVANKDRYQKLLEISPVAIMMIGLSGTIEMVNRSAVELFEFDTMNDLIGKNIFDYISPKDIPLTKKALQKVVTEGEVVDVEYESVRNDGSRFITSASGSLLKNKYGMPQAVIGTLRDITRQKELDRAKNEFVSIASHQLRTPLSNMRWNLELLKNGHYGPLKEKAAEVINDIYEADMVMIHLVEELLSVTRTQSGKVREKIESIDPIAEIEKIINQIKPSADLRGIKITLTKSGEIPSCKIDTVKFGEVITNLLTNAVTYNKDKGKIAVNLAKDGHFLAVEVRDTGIGISSSEKEFIFEKFYRTKSAAAVSPGGTGLGLFLAKRYVEGWGGQITFESSVSGGTTFMVKIPLEPRLLTKKVPIDTTSGYN
jgi:PAS domain S-box-containing protein